MEARSLGTVNYLAANPPQYPVNPAEQRREAVTLYISRVPGTRDVILSPFKPQLKNVSPEDVASSLYYIHHDTSPTAFIPEEPPRSSNDSNRSRTIPRKPVPGAVQQQASAAAQIPTPVASPGTPPVAAAPVAFPVKSPAEPPIPTPGTPEDPPPEYEPTPSPAYQEAQALNPKAPLPPSSAVPGPSISNEAPSSRAAASDELFLSPSHPPPGHMNPHPLPALPDEPPSLLSPPPIPAKIPLDQPGNDVEDDPPPPPLPPRNLSLPTLQTGIPTRKPVNTSPPDADPINHAPHSAVEPFSSTERSYDIDYSPRPSTSHSLQHETQLTEPRINQETQPRLSLSQRPGTEAFALILIRRDPSTGLQWNVAKVNCQQTDLASATPLHEESDAAVAATPQAHPAMDIQIQNTGYAKFRHNRPRRSAEHNGDHTSAAAARAQQADPTLFTRQVAMFYSKSWATNFREKLNQIDKEIKHNSRSRKLSNESSGSSKSAEGPATSVGIPLPGMKPRGYIFTSPWDTRCEFRTGDGGRSLRLMHILGDSVPPTFSEDGESHQPSSVVLSELRFNLPNTDLFHSTHDKNLANVQNQLGNLSKFWKQKRAGHREYDDDEDDDYDYDPVSPFDLSVGKENAGGGSRGTRVKMGKLIIFHDGLKMLDLVVAANMGVWWKSWEKNF